MIKSVALAHYSIQMVSALALLGKCCQNYVMGWGTQEGGIQVQLGLHRFCAMLLIIELGFVAIGKAKGSVVRRAWGAVGQVVLCLGFLQSSSSRLEYLYLALLFSTVECLRCGHNIWPKIGSLGTLRYNIQILGTTLMSYFSLLLLSDYISINAEDISYEMINAIRLIQLAFMIHAVVSFRMLVRERKEYLKQGDKIKKI